jgi:hypothetical protein
MQTIQQAPWRARQLEPPRAPLRSRAFGCTRHSSLRASGGRLGGASTTAHQRAKPLPLRSGGEAGWGIHHRASAREAPPPAQRGEAGWGASGGGEARCRVRLPSAPIPAFPRKRGKGFRARALWMHAGTPPPAQRGEAGWGASGVDEVVGALQPPSAPIPAFPRKRGKGLCAAARRRQRDVAGRWHTIRAMTRIRPIPPRPGCRPHGGGAAAGSIR